MIRKQFALIVLSAVVFAAIPRASNPAPAFGVMDAAKKEGVVVFYSSIDTPTLNAVAQRFNETHAGITVQALRIDGNKIPPRITTEQEAGTYNVDVVSADDFPMSQLDATGLLQTYRPPEASKFVKGSLDAKMHWVALYDLTTVIAWNPQKLKADGLQAPRSLADLARPEWKGKIGIDTTAFNWYAGVLATQPGSRDVMQKIAANKPFLTTGHTVTVAQLETGEFDATPTAYGYMAEHERKLGRAVDFLNPHPLIVTLAPIALVKNAPHPNAARVFLDWLLSREGQNFLVESSERTSARSDVANDPRVFGPKQDYYVLPAPDRTQYNTFVSQYRALLGMTN